MLRREINPHIRVIDEKNGIVQYTATTPTQDSYQEIVVPTGADFSDFERNSPFVDSHDYSSIDSLLGRVVDWDKDSKSVSNTVKWAIDVPANTLALKGFQMTAGGYLKAVSIGFMATHTVTPYDRDLSGWREQCEKLGIDANETDCRGIYTAWKQKELSACILGANPDALARSHAAGIWTDADVAKVSAIHPAFARRFETAIQPARHRSFSFAPAMQDAAVDDMLSALKVKNPTPAPSMQTITKPDSTDDFSRLTGDAKRAYENIEFARRTDTTAEIERAVRRAFAGVERERRHSYGDPVERYFSQKPERRFLWNAVFKKAGVHLQGKDLTPLELHALQHAPRHKAVSGISLQDQFGLGMLASVAVADEVYDLLLHYGAYRDLGLRKMVGAFTKYAEATQFPNAIFITQPNLGQTTIPDVGISGAWITPEANTIAALINVSLEWFNDNQVDLGACLLGMFLQGLASRIDFAAFQGTGANDQNSGEQVGLFYNQQIANYQAANGKATIAQLERSDFLNCVASANVAVLQRMITEPPRWYIHPGYIPALLQIPEGAGTKYVLKTPAETGGEWQLVGFPVTWAAQAYSPGSGKSRVAMWGNPSAYLVALQEQFEIIGSENAGFGSHAIPFRAIGRGYCALREISGFAGLELAGPIVQ